MTLADRYIARLMFGPLVGTLLVSALLLLIQRVQRLLNFVVNEGGPVSLVWEMLANTVPGYLSLGLTIGLLLGVLLTFRRLAISSELDIFRGIGISHVRLLRVPYLYAIGLAAANFAVIGFVQPHARYRNEALQYDVRSGVLGAAIRTRDFQSIQNRGTLRVDAIEPDGRTLAGVFLQSHTRGGTRISASASTATMLAAADRNAIVFRLHDGVLVSEKPGQPVPRVLNFASHDVWIPLPRIDGFRARGTGRWEEFTFPELLARGASHLAPAERAPARAELHFRLAQIASMFVVPLLALGLGVPPKRSTSALGVFLALVIVILWFKVDQYAAQAAAAGRIDAVPAMWLPFLLFTSVGVWMVYRLDRTPGGQPIAALEQGWRRIGGHLARWRRQPPV